jgi:hypothetical protein
MTNEQFDALVMLKRGNPDCLSNMAARAVLVAGMRQADAVREFGVSRSSVRDAVVRYGNAHALLQSVYTTEIDGVGSDDKAPE